MLKLILVLALSLHGTQKDIRPANGAELAITNQRGTDSLPVSVKLLNTGESEATAKQEAQRLDEERRNTRSNLNLTRGLVGATLLTLFVLIYQSFWLQRSVTHAEKATQIELRAYVAVEITGYTPATTDQPLTFTMTCTNVGQTPAFDVVVWSMNRAVLPFPLDNVRKLHDTPSDTDSHSPHRLVLYPQTHATVQQSGSMPPITPDEIATVNQPIPENGEHPPQLYCFGTIHYRDIFLKQHWLHYCSTFGGDLTKPNLKNGSVSHIYNDTSDNPAHYQHSTPSVDQVHSSDS